MTEIPNLPISSDVIRQGLRADGEPLSPRQAAVRWLLIRLMGKGDSVNWDSATDVLTGKVADPKKIPPFQLQLPYPSIGVPIGIEVFQRAAIVPTLRFQVSDGYTGILKDFTEERISDYWFAEAALDRVLKSFDPQTSTTYASLRDLGIAEKEIAMRKALIESRIMIENSSKLAIKPTAELLVVMLHNHARRLGITPDKKLIQDLY